MTTTDAYTADVVQRIRHLERRGVVFEVVGGVAVARVATGEAGGNVAAWVAEHREVIAAILGAR